VFGPSESKKHLLESEVGGHGRHEVIVNADAVDSSKHKTPANLNRFGNPSAAQKESCKSQQICKTVSESSIKENQPHTTKPPKNHLTKAPE
jgi:hypothetical protein